jgi:hypothetical protein
MEADFVSREHTMGPILIASDGSMRTSSYKAILNLYKNKINRAKISKVGC